ncbi:MAG TPA: hypothetical protein VNW94_06375 [Streptosporangiaceae bacterium]|nr:hypothetical protein [Streptosporangiaceae bacterium]
MSDITAVDPVGFERLQVQANDLPAALEADWNRLQERLKGLPPVTSGRGATGQAYVGQMDTSVGFVEESRRGLQGGIDVLGGQIQTAREIFRGLEDHNINNSRTIL